MESLNKKIIKRKTVYENTRKGTLKLAQIADNSSYRKSLKQKKGDDKKGEGVRGRYKIRILGEHTGSLASQATEWAYPPQLSGTNPIVSTGNPFFPKGSWVYVYQIEETGEYFIDRPSPNTVCQQSPENSGFEAGDTYLLIPDTMYKGTGLPNCASVFNSQVKSEIDEKQDGANKTKILFPKWCDAKKGDAAGPGIEVAIENSVKIRENLNKAVKPLADFQIAIDNANKNLVGVGDTRGFFQALRQNDVTIQSFNNSIAIYQKNLKKTAEEISGWINGLLTKLKAKLLRKVTLGGNILKGLIPTSGRFIVDDYWDKGVVKILACLIQRMMYFMNELVLKALSSFLGKVINATKCLVENFIGEFLGQLLGQLSGLINGVLGGVSAALSKISGAIDAGLDLVDAIGATLEDILSFFKCEIEYCVGEDKVIRWSVLNGAKPERVTIDFNNVFKKAKDVGAKFRDLTKVPEDVANFDFNFDIDDAVQEIFDKCDAGPLFCGKPDISFWGGGGSGGSGNAVISVTGDLLGIDIINAGNYTSAPLVDVEDPCGNGNGGTGTVIIGPITGIGTVGVGTTGGITGIGTLGVGTDPTYPGDGGQGTTAGTGITYQVTVHDLTPEGIVGATDNRFFIDDKQQKTLTFDRGNTYILNQEDESNYGHPLRFSQTQGGTWAGGSEYRLGVTIDGIPGLGASTTDTAYSRMVVNNNTPDRLYYYCENHPKMGGVINVTGTSTDGIDDDGTTTGTTTTTGTGTTGTGTTGTTGITTTTTGGGVVTTVSDGQNATLVVSSVNPTGGIIAVKNLQGGTGYNECMSNVTTHGGSGTGFTIRIIKTENGSIKSISINSKGSSYKVGDILTIIAKTTTRTTTGTTITTTGETVTTFGITKVLINSSGYGYLSSPDGSLGGMNRTWATRCQTIVQRKSLDWDSPYSEGDFITLYSGDWIQLPGKSKVYIDDDFNVSKLPGAQIVGVSSYIPKDMTDFPLSDKTGITSTSEATLNYNFETATLIPTFAPDGLYDWQGQGPTGIARTEAADEGVSATIADWNFYLNGEYLGLFQQNDFSEVPQIRVGDIAYRVGTPRSFTPTDSFDNQIPWVRSAALSVLQGSWVLTDRAGWSSFLKTYGVYPDVTDPQYKLIGTSTATWRVATFTPGQYIVEMQADNVGTIYWDGVKLGSTLPYAGHNRELKFEFFAGDVEPAIHEIKVEIENKNFQDPNRLTNRFVDNPAAVAWVLKDPYGAIVKTSLDAYDVVDAYADLLYKYDSYFSIKGYNIKEDKDDVTGEWFNCEDDYKRARLLGFTDCDIRAYLEGTPEIQLDACMRGKLDDDNWGRCDGDLMVSLTAPGCPKDPCLPNNTYPVIVCLDEIIIENPGFGFDCCKDTVKIEPANGAKAKIEECRDGQIIRIVVTDCGSGFTELPEISINTETGFNTILKPIMKFHRPEEIDVPLGTPVIQVVDCVGKVN